MGLDSDIERATSKKNTSEQWGCILDVCDKASKSAEDSRNCLRAILKRLNNPDPHIAIQAATLLDACVSNCGKTFHIEIASKEFENEYTKLIKKCHAKVQQKLKESLKKWAENEFKTDQQLNLIPSLYSKLKGSGIDFSVEIPAKKAVTLSKDPNVVQSQEEEDQIAKAIELSLKETSRSPWNSTALYPTNLGASGLGLTTTTAAATPTKEPRKVRVLYDFEAAEDNELTLTAGEIIVVIDDSDANWWKGSNQRGDGLFPASFVTANLSDVPEQLDYDKAKKIVQFKEAEVKEEKAPEAVEINEDKSNRLIHLLHEADPTNPEQHSQEILKLEREVNGMGPLIDTELERVDRKRAQLTQLSSDLVEAQSLYHMLMRKPQYAPINKMPYGYPQGVPSSGSVSHQNEAKPLLTSQNVDVDANTATTSGLVTKRQSRKRTASDARIKKNQSKEHEQNDLNINVANDDGVPRKKKSKVEVKQRTQPQSKKYSSTSGKMNMTVSCGHDIVTSTPEPNPYVLPIYSVNHPITTQLSPIQKHSFPLSDFPRNPFTNFEDLRKIVLRYADDQKVPSITNKIVEDPSVKTIEQSLCGVPGRNGGVPVAEEDAIAICDCNNSEIEVIPGPSVPTNIKASKNNQTKRLQQQKTKDSEEEIPISVCNKEQVSTSSIHLQDCPVCLNALDNKLLSCTICGHIFCTPCITDIVKSKKKCPICRTRLTKKQMHPLFI